MNKLRVLLDVDQVLTSFIDLYVSCAKKAGVLKEPVPFDWEPECWDIGDALNLNQKEKDKVHKYLNRNNVGKYMKSLPGHCYVKELMNLDGVEVFFVTTSYDGSPTWDHDRRYWIKERFGRKARSNLVFTEKKEVVEGAILLDDKVENVLKWAKRHPQGKGIVWPWKYNISLNQTLQSLENDPWPQNVVRPNQRDWQWVISYVQNLLNINNSGISVATHPRERTQEREQEREPMRNMIYRYKY